MIRKYIQQRKYKTASCITICSYQRNDRHCSRLPQGDLKSSRNLRNRKTPKDHNFCSPKAARQLGMLNIRGWNSNNNNNIIKIVTLAALNIKAIDGDPYLWVVVRSPFFHVKESILVAFLSCRVDPSLLCRVQPVPCTVSNLCSIRLLLRRIRSSSYMVRLLLCNFRFLWQGSVPGTHSSIFVV